jgi:hypothetical protein
MEDAEVIFGNVVAVVVAVDDVEGWLRFWRWAKVADKGQWRVKNACKRGVPRCGAVDVEGLDDEEEEAEDRSIKVFMIYKTEFLFLISRLKDDSRGEGKKDAVKK